MLLDFSSAKLSRYEPSLFIAVAERFEISLHGINTQKNKGKREVLEKVVERLEPGAEFSLEAILSIIGHITDRAVGEDDLAGLYVFALAIEDHKKEVARSTAYPTKESPTTSKRHYN